MTSCFCFVHYNVLEQLFNSQFHLPNQFQMTVLISYIVHWLLRLCIKMLRC